MPINHIFKFTTENYPDLVVSMHGQKFINNTALSGRYKVIVGMITLQQNFDCCIAITTKKTAVTSLRD
jgi:hypothetical protein